MRKNWLDSLRGLCIIFILFRHLDPTFIVPNELGSRSINCIFCAFSVQIFFVISGMLYREGRFFFKITTWGLNYLKLTIINYVLVMLLEAISFRSFSSTLSRTPGYIWGVIYGHSQYLPNCAPLWYVPCAMVSYAMFELIMRVKSKVGRVVISLCYISMYTFEQMVVPGGFQLPWHAETALLGATFMYIGYELIKILPTILCGYYDIAMALALLIGFRYDFIYMWAIDMDQFYLGGSIVKFYILTIMTAVPTIYFFLRFDVRSRFL